MPPLIDPSASAHRPWPLPPGSFALHMVWHDLAFLHWPVEPGCLAEEVPSGLELDTFDGSAWLGVVPFRMSGVRPRFAPSVPGLSSFPEINLRTYVRAGGKAGVWFFSLDVPKRLAVRVARGVFHLPYFRARMRVEERAGAIHYASQRTGGEHAGVGFLGNLPAGRGGLPLRTRLARGVPDRALLPLRRGSERAALPRRHPPRAVAAAAGRGRVRAERPRPPGGPRRAGGRPARALRPRARGGRVEEPTARLGWEWRSRPTPGAPSCRSGSRARPAGSRPARS